MNRRFYKGGTDDVAPAIPLAEIGDELLIIADGQASLRLLGLNAIVCHDLSAHSCPCKKRLIDEMPPERHNKRKKETALWQSIPLAVP